MKNIRYLLYGLLLLISLMLFNAWQKEHPKAAVPATQASTTQATNSGQGNVSHNPAQIVQLTNQKLKDVPADRLITVKTDMFKAKIDKLGGDLVQSDLLKYPLTLKSPKPFVLLNDQPNNLYIAQSGLTRASRVSNQSSSVLYSATQNQYELKAGQNQLQVVLKANQHGLAVTKTYVFYPNQYKVDVTYNIKNQSGKSWTGNYYMQIVHDVDAPTSKGFLHGHIPSFEGVAIYSPDKRYEQFKVSKLQDEPLNRNIVGGWLAAPQHYFLSAWVPDSKAAYHYYSQVTAGGMYTAGMIGHQMTINSGKTATLSSTFYMGPKIAKNLDAVAPFLSHTIDFGWLWFISVLLFKVMSFVNGFIGNWGWTIIIITILIKLLFYKLSATSYISMANMRKLQPRLKGLKEKHGDDREAMSRATMALYKEEGINPLGGCLPILVQIPVFIALYYVLLESVELRQAPFMFWIHDLSVKDPYFILPILMGLTMYFQQKLSPAPPDPTQAKVMMFLPVLMTLLFMNFPAGLVLYWFVNNLLSVLQQWYVTKRIESGAYKRKKRK